MNKLELLYMHKWPIKSDTVIKYDVDCKGEYFFENYHDNGYITNHVEKVFVVQKETKCFA